MVLAIDCEARRLRGMMSLVSIDTDTIQTDTSEPVDDGTLPLPIYPAMAIRGGLENQ